MSKKYKEYSEEFSYCTALTSTKQRKGTDVKPRAISSLP